MNFQISDQAAYILWLLQVFHEKKNIQIHFSWYTLHLININNYLLTASTFEVPVVVAVEALELVFSNLLFNPLFSCMRNA